MSTTTQRLCPHDQEPLVEVERAGVLIDACPVCRGIWLDRGELDKLVELEGRAAKADDDFLAEVGGRRPSDGDDEDDEREKRPDKKRERGSFFENFLDFGG